MTDRYDYTAFGDVYLAQTAGTTFNSYLYTGQHFDSFSDFYDLRARQYDPLDGRFLGRDQAEMDYDAPLELNRYVYAANNPINYADPSGYGLISYVQLHIDKAKQGSIAALQAVGRQLQYWYLSHLSLLIRISHWVSALSCPVVEAATDAVLPCDVLDIPRPVMGVRPKNSPLYTVFYEVKIPVVKGTGRRSHFQAANKGLHEFFTLHPDMARVFDGVFPGIVDNVRPGAGGVFADGKPHRLLTWHHYFDEADASSCGILQLVLTSEHKAPGSIQKSLHPKGSGGFKNCWQ